MKNVWRNFVYSGLDRPKAGEEPGPRSYNRLGQLRFINICCLLGLVALLVYALSPGGKFVYFSQPVLVGLIFFFPALFLFLRFTHKLKSAAFILLTLFMVGLLYGLYYTHFHYSILFMIHLLPITSFYLCGTKGGLIRSGLFVVAYIVLYLAVTPGSISILIPGNSSLTGLLSFFLVSLFAFHYEHNRTKMVGHLQEQLYNDRLTGLPNRSQLLRDINSCGTCALFLLNVDDFKEINSTYGHLFGDQALLLLRDKLAKALPSNAQCFYKLAADEFAVLFSQNRQEYSFVDLENIAFLISRQLATHQFVLEDQPLRIRLTMGIALVDAEERGELLSRADIALKTAKRTHRDFLFYHQVKGTQKRYQENMEWTRKLSDAIMENRILPYFQPIVRNSDGVILHHECLARMLDLDGTIHSPIRFLPIAKKIRLYPTITRMIVKKTLNAFENTPRSHFSLNISLDDILDRFTMSFIRKTFERNPEFAHAICFEILESEGIENFEQVSGFIRSMKERGCKIAIDDFGSGYSNFDHILRLNVDILKIDGSLVKHIHTNQNSRIIVENITRSAHELGMATVAEYVHCREVLDICREIGIEASQGFFIGPPQAEPAKGSFQALLA